MTKGQKLGAGIACLILTVFLGGFLRSEDENIKEKIALKDKIVFVDHVKAVTLFG